MNKDRNNLDRAAKFSFIPFMYFYVYQANWKALRGALVGCLAFLRRKSDVGILTNHDVLEVTHSFLENHRLQSMAGYERKLSLQVIECLFDRYNDAIVDLVS
ncbi:MMS19 nucleotide excision repair protein-like protein [Striga asiatica]|uniref:MMS19 nucleotide excision repair protein n=1 Tax=Striga asiatica TaxID=4170 RepID=A0A5A7P7E7_STRAF|nr:MMS19 nucleotide excision repair protein-like protein [Striga asiatica]